MVFGLLLLFLLGDGDGDGDRAFLLGDGDGDRAFLFGDGDGDRAFLFGEALAAAAVFVSLSPAAAAEGSYSAELVAITWQTLAGSCGAFPEAFGFSPVSNRTMAVIMVTWSATASAHMNTRKAPNAALVAESMVNSIS